MNGCYNKPRPIAGAVTHWAQAGWREVHAGWLNIERVPVWTPIKHVMTTDCQYTKTTPDPLCAGCVHEARRE